MTIIFLFFSFQGSVTQDVQKNLLITGIPLFCYSRSITQGHIENLFYVLLCYSKKCYSRCMRVSFQDMTSIQPDPNQTMGPKITWLMGIQDWGQMKSGKGLPQRILWAKRLRTGLGEGNFDNPKQ